MSEFVDGDLASRALARAERHVGECEDCSRLLAELRMMLDALHALPAPARGRQDMRQIAAAVRARLRESREAESL